MKMRSWLKLMLATSFLATSTLASAATVLPKESKVTWVGKKVSGEHVGTVKLKSGSFDLSKGNGDFVIDMKSINNNDLSGDWKKKLEDHLKSDDFFNVEKYPEASFKLKKAEKKSADKYMLSGDLTVKGITKPISFPATLSETNGMKKLSANFTIDRLKWDIKYNSGKFFDVKKLGDKMIYDDISFDVDLVAK